VAVSTEIKRLEKSRLRLSFTVPKDDVREKYQEILKEYSKKLQIPGFRKGKVPHEVLERKYAEALKGEALARIVESAIQDVFKDGNLNRKEKPISYSTPVLEETPALDLDQDLQFSVVYDVLPEVKIGQWKGLTVEYPYAEIEDDDINRELLEIQERNAYVTDRDEGAGAQNGAVVTINYAIFKENGEKKPDMERKDFVFTMGNKSNYYQFDDAILGMKKNETKEFEKTFPSELSESTLAGQTRKVEITLLGIKEKKLPEIDDELAQDVDEKFKKLGDLKNSIREKLSKNLEIRQRYLKIKELLRKIMENTPVDIPESLILAEIEGRIRNTASYYKIDTEALMNMMTPEREEEWRSIAEKTLHPRLIIETLIEEQNLTITDEDLERELEQIATNAETNVEEVKKNYNEEAMYYLREEIKERRIADLLLAENNFIQGKKENYLDLMSDNN
jgi:trigger factor